MLLATIRKTAAKRGLLPRGHRVIAACSGGPDSIAMTHALARLAPELGITLEVSSVDHGLRASSADEVARVGHFAASLGLPFHALTVAVDRADASLQASARRARYEALLALRQRRGAQVVAVAHTRDDQAETVLERLLRGSGVGGLSGIAPRRADGVIRPLLDATRAEVESYVHHHGLTVVRDPTNDDISQRRARLRHFILPLLVEEDANVTVHLADLADDAREVSSDLEQRADEWLERAGITGSLPLDALATLPAALRAEVVSRWVERAAGASPGRRARTAIDRLVASGGGPVWLPNDWAVIRGGSTLVLERRDPSQLAR